MFTSLANTLANTASLSAKGVSLVEYALLVALIAVFCITAVTAFAGWEGRRPFSFNSTA